MKSYDAILIHPALSNGRCAGELFVFAQEIVFRSEEMNHSIPAFELKVQGGGAGNRFIFFSSSKQDAISIYTSNKSIVKEPYLKENTELTSLLTSTKKTIRKPLVGILSGIFVILAFIGILYASKNYLIERIAKVVPIEWEKSVGDKLFETLSLNYHFIENDSRIQPTNATF